jgi:hypothetical protein
MVQHPYLDVCLDLSDCNCPSGLELRHRVKILSSAVRQKGFRVEVSVGDDVAEGEVRRVPQLLLSRS